MGRLLERWIGRGGEGRGTGGNLLGMDPEAVRVMLLRNVGRAADDSVGSHDMYDDDAVLYVGEPFDAPDWRARWRVAP